MAYSNSKAEKALLNKIYKPANSQIQKIEDALVELIETKRKLQITDMILVKQLAAQLFVNLECVKDITKNGRSIETTSRGELVVKENPNSRNFQASSTQIQKLYKQLGLDPVVLDEAQDEDDPLTKALNDLND
ncbi:P27 family phage terminase small subunit [Aeromonas hydrophila]|uniref:P27 family phage terminase small subunit n=1 Tax=Aeromonas hydrophila TaxID=644 RepID=UPI0038CF70FB